jgi:hypothetical protein
MFIGILLQQPGSIFYTFSDAFNMISIFLLLRLTSMFRFSLLLPIKQVFKEHEATHLFSFLDMVIFQKWKQYPLQEGICTGAG